MIPKGAVMDGSKKRLQDAKRRVRELENELNEYLARYPDKELHHFERDRHYKLLLRQLENAETVVGNLERQSRGK